MKRAISLLLVLALFSAFAVPAAALGEEVMVYTQESSFTVGGTVSIDCNKTLISIYNDGLSDEYNSYLEGNVQYYWMRNGSYYADGMTLTITENDRGCEFYCLAALYRDEEHTQQNGSIVSPKFTVPNATIPTITTKSLPEGRVGEAYYQKLECTDPDVAYSLFRTSLPNGLYITQHGEIEGTPEKAGVWHVVVMATPEAGEDYAATAEFDIEITEAAEKYSLEIVNAPDKVTYTVGEKLDITGLFVRIHTPDGTVDSHNGEGLEYSLVELTAEGEQKIKVSYKDSFEFFVVTVEAAKESDSTQTDSEDEATTAAETTKEVTDSRENKDKKDEPENKDEKKNSTMSWWGIALIVIGAAGAGVGGTVVFVVLKKKKEFSDKNN